MGRGNWLPDLYIDGGESDLVYVELLEPDESLDEDTIRDEYDNFLSEVGRILGKSFDRVQRGDRDYSCRSRDTVCIFKNGLVQIQLDGQGDYWHQGIAVVAREDAPAFADSRVELYGSKLWRGLHECGYTLSRRTSAWTSAEFTPGQP